jgi:ArsR family transcriptional regulator
MTESSRGVKTTLHESFAAVAKAASHPHRLALLEQLAQGERNVDTLAEKVGLTIANASQHLQSMRRAGLLAVRRMD